MLGNSPYKSQADYAIIKVLKDSREPLRYNELHRKASSVLGNRIWIKTFNDHLKRLCEDGEIIRNEKTRYHVTYEPARKYRDEEREEVELEKKFLGLLLRFASEAPKKLEFHAKKLEFRDCVVKSLVKLLAQRRKMVKTILSATLALAEGKEREAQMVLDEYFLDYRIVLNHFMTILSKIDGITQIANEMTEEWIQEYRKIMREIEARMQEVKALTQEVQAGREVSDPYVDILNLSEAIEEFF